MTLFDAEQYRVAVPTPVNEGRPLTLGQRQAAKLAAGLHPLSRRGDPIRLHADAAPGDDKTAPGLRCGSCRHLVNTEWNGKRHPKCAYGIDPRATPMDYAPRAAHSANTDCRSWWSACREYEGVDES